MAGEAPSVTLQAFGARLRFLADRADSGGQFGVEENTMPAGLTVPPHDHRTYDEVLYVIEGELTLVVGERTATVPAGSLGFAPRGTPHTIQNQGTAPAKVLVVSLPAAKRPI